MTCCYVVGRISRQLYNEATTTPYLTQQDTRNRKSTSNSYKPPRQKINGGGRITTPDNLTVKYPPRRSESEANILTICTATRDSGVCKVKVQQLANTTLAQFFFALSLIRLRQRLYILIFAKQSPITNQRSQHQLVLTHQLQSSTSMHALST